MTFVNNISLFVYIDFSDKSHVKKNIVKRLYELRSKHKELSIKVVNAISKKFSYMVSQNKGNVSGIENGLKALVTCSETMNAAHQVGVDIRETRHISIQNFRMVKTSFHKI